MAANSYVTLSPTYKNCISLASSNPTLALAQAQSWLEKEDGVPALHCRAMALYGLGRYQEAAEALTQLHPLIPNDNITLRSFVSRHASLAWLKADNAQASQAALDQQINELLHVTTNKSVAIGLASDLLMERAHRNKDAGKFTPALRDFSRAININPTNTDALLERAYLLEYLHNVSMARADAKAVLALSPKNEAAEKLLARLAEQSSPNAAKKP